MRILLTLGCLAALACAIAGCDAQTSAVDTADKMKMLEQRAKANPPGPGVGIEP